MSDEAPRYEVYRKGIDDLDQLPKYVSTMLVEMRRDLSVFK